MYSRYLAVDSHRMLHRVLSFPIDLASSAKEYSSIGVKLPPLEDLVGVIIAGMGGSFIGGLFLQDALYEKTEKALIPIRETLLPSYINSHYLLIAVSYSGNTEETIRVALEAYRRKIPIVAVASGGLLAKLAEAWKIPFVKVPSGLQPRAAFPYMGAALAAIVEALGLAPGLLENLRSAALSLERASSSVLAASDTLAKWLHDRYNAGDFPIVYSYRPYLSAGYRFKTQLNENAKLHAFHSEIPESNHNEIMGWEGPFRFSTVLVRAREEPAYIRYRIEFLKELFAEKGIKYTEVRAQGENRMEELLSLFYTFDVASVLLALLRGIDPAPTTTINNLKRYLEERINISLDIERITSQTGSRGIRQDGNQG